MGTKWRTLLVAALVGVPVLAVGALAVWRAPSTPDALEIAVAAAEARAAARVRTREIVWGEPQEGLAFDFYAQAAELARELTAMAWDPKRAEFYEPREGHRIVLAAHELQARRTAWKPVFELVSRGAHCVTSDTRSSRWPQFAFAAGEVEVRLLLRDEQWRAAVHLSLDWATMTTEHDRLPAHPWHAWTDPVVRSLPLATAAELDAGLERLDARLVPCDVGAVIASFARPLLDGFYEAGHWSLDDRLVAWDWSFDPTAKHTDAFRILFAEMQAWPHDGNAAAWSARWKSLAGRPDLTHSYLVIGAVGTAQGRMEAHAYALTWLRMLRIGLAVRLAQPVPALLDPYDDQPLRVEDLGGSVVVHARAPGLAAVSWTRR